MPLITSNLGARDVEAGVARLARAQAQHQLAHRLAGKPGGKGAEVGEHVAPHLRAGIAAAGQRAVAHGAAHYGCGAVKVGIVAGCRRLEGAVDDVEGRHVVGSRFFELDQALPDEVRISVVS